MEDILGIKPIGKAVDKVAGATIDAAKVFLGTVCKPALEEFGLMLSDKIRYWRYCNISKMLVKAKGKIEFANDKLTLTANPKVALNIMDYSSMEDDETLQDMWAGLFASTCTKDGKDDSNMIYVDMLKRLSRVEAKILQYACLHATSQLYPNELSIGSKFMVSFDEIAKIAETSDKYIIDGCLDHLIKIGLLRSTTFETISGFDAADKTLEAGITPSGLGLSLFYKASGSPLSMLDFYKDHMVIIKKNEQEEQKS